MKLLPCLRAEPLPASQLVEAWTATVGAAAEAPPAVWHPIHVELPGGGTCST
jgi:hypothetical protein